MASERGTNGHGPPNTPEEFDRRYVVDPSGCWLWTGYIAPNGYGLFPIHSVVWTAHRWSYVHKVGPVPRHLVVDHLCRVRHCVNPDHLEPVTRSENAQRGIAARARESA